MPKTFRFSQKLRNLAKSGHTELRLEPVWTQCHHHRQTDWSCSSLSDFSRSKFKPVLTIHLIKLARTSLISLASIRTTNVLASICISLTHNWLLFILACFVLLAVQEPISWTNFSLILHWNNALWLVKRNNTTIFNQSD